MTVAHWGAQAPPPPPPSLDEQMIIQVAIPDDDGWIIFERAQLDARDPILSAVAGFTWRAKADSPGLAAVANTGGFARGPQSPPCLVFQDGQIIARGYIDNPEITFADGWYVATCYSMPGHLTHASVGSPANNLLGDTMDGWLPVNCTATSASSAGLGGALEVREKDTDDAGKCTESNPYRSIHKNANIGSRDHNAVAHTSAYLEVTPDTLKAPKGTIKARCVLWPLDMSTHQANRFKVVLEWSLPDNLPLGRAVFCQGPDIELALNHPLQIRYGLWGPRGTGGAVWSQVMCVIDDGIGVDAGDNAASFVGVVLTEGTYQAGVPIVVHVAGSSDLVFDSAVRLPTQGHADVMGSIGTYNQHTDWWYDDRTNLLTVTGYKQIGAQRFDLVATTDDSSSHRVLTAGAPSSTNVANKILVQAPDGSFTRAEYESVDAAFALWEHFEVNQDGSLPIDLPGFADALMDAYNAPQRSYTVALGPPPGGRTPLDWMIDGPTWSRLNPGDRFQVRPTFGAYDLGEWVQITHLTADYQTGLVATEVKT